MDNKPAYFTNILLLFLFCLFPSLSFLNVHCSADAAAVKTAVHQSRFVQDNNSPFSPRASLIRYWNSHISNNLPKPSFLLSKASPLNAIQAARLTQLASQNSLSTHLDSFCSSANLYCPFQDSTKPTTSTNTNHPTDSNFAHYNNQHFANYGASRLSGVDSFKNYSDGMNLPDDSFTRYSRESTGHKESFANYEPDANVANGTFTNYGTGATGGSGGFDNYDSSVNVPHLKFTTYDSDANGHDASFSRYSQDTNSGDETFTTYGKSANGAPTGFTNYANDSNSINSGFSGYGESGNAANDTFKGYGGSGNNPHSTFKGYGGGVNSGSDSFVSYRDGANVGDDTFQSYGKSSNAIKESFVNYGKTFNGGVDNFKEYAKGAKNQQVDFKSYGLNTTFKAYANKGVTFSQYTNASDSDHNHKAMDASGNFINRWVEPGKFFRESMIKEGNVAIMPDIRDKMPPRSFLPRSIASKLPFSTSRLGEIKGTFRVADNSTMERVLLDALADCERAPSPDETKRCVGSVEDMIDFAVSVLGHNIVVRTTENVKGSKKNVMIGKVRGINGGNLTKSVSCHQSLYPYLLYYCHAVPKVRVYEAEILDVESKAKINQGVAICHVDTSAWSQGHGAFVALGSSPGLIEVCHWIFENDMTWAIADSKL